MSDYKKYQCTVCEHIYDEAEGDERSNIPAGTLWENIPDDWCCPECGAVKALFELIENVQGF